ncbi:disulfide bond formation protein DsbA, partial [Bacillus tropicus]|nr:disulfide bond formation protein DsbA [Bacillus tropicus]
MNDYWYPQVIGEMNDDQIQLFKANGDFIWHEHPNTDKLF